MNPSLERVAKAWLIAWGISYIATAAFAPGIGGSSVEGAVVYSLLGAAILAAVACRTYTAHARALVPSPIWIVGRWLLAILGLIEVIGCVASWTGLSMWNVPFANKEMFQVSMAAADLISAVFMFLLAE